MTFYEAANIAKEADVKELWLTHFSPSLVRPDLYLKPAQEIFSHTKLGKDKKSIVLEFDKNE